MTDPVDALFLGPDKAGSSWIQRLLEQHPGVAVPTAKELFWLDRFYDRGRDWYLGQFPDRPEGGIRVEVCHDYLFSPDAARRAAYEMPGVRLLVVVRNPLDRAVSSYLYMRRQGRVDVPFSQALRTVDELVDHGRYGRHVSSWLRHHSREQLTVLDFSQLRDDPAGFASAVLEGLGAPAWTPQHALLEPVRSASAARHQGLATAGKRTAEMMRRVGLERTVGRIKANPTIERLLFRPIGKGERPEVDEALRAWFAERLVEDTHRLDSILGTSYATIWWKQFA